MQKKIKIIILLISLFVVILAVLSFSNKKIGKKIFFLLNNESQTIVLSIFNNDKTTKKIQNDIKSKFLPETQQLKVDVRKIRIENLKENKVGYGGKAKTKKSFYIEEYKNNIFISDVFGNIFFSSLDNLNKKSKNFNKIENNLSNIKVKDFLFDEGFIYLSTVQNDKKCNKIKLFKSKLNFKKLMFKEIFSSQDCDKLYNIQAGRIVIFKNKNEKFILLATNTDETSEAGKKEYISYAQNPESIFGKTILIDLKDFSYKIFSLGHRNILGLYFDEKSKFILATENGPEGGDEINKIEIDENYGWNLSSYGESYNKQRSDKPNYKKNHKRQNFKEPIISFIPAIAPTQIVRIHDNFSIMWKDNFIMGSLVGKSLYRIKFDDDFNKVFFIEKIFIGERIRDVVFSKSLNAILLAMEDSGSIGIIKNFENSHLR